jgi:molybdopterin/thiamine biosynthesis adenylyltransferase/proteasome lid subunit RPN8/RPN11
VYLADWVLRAVDADLGGHPPERGGALLGPRRRPLLTHFVPDPGAAVTSTSYEPSRALAARVHELERGADLELKGIVHSHAAGLDRPSDQDLRELAAGLRLNPHLASYAGPIVSSVVDDSTPDAHELPLRAGKISFFAAHRTREGGAEIRPLRVTLVPLLRDLERAARELGGAPPDAFVSDAGHGAVLAGRLRLPGALELLLLASELYPSLPPVLLLSGAGETEQLQLPWALAAPEEERLVAALRTVFEGAGPFRRAHGPRGGPALTRDAGRARLAGWEPRLTGEDLDARADAHRAALLSRGAGLLSDALRDRSALVAGCGSVGSYLAEQLVRGGVGRLALLDPEPVEAANLSRTVYTAEDVGRPKPEALARRLLQIDPAVALALEPRAVEELAVGALDALVRSADLVVAATDDPAAQRALDRFAYARGKPALFVGLYAGARGGEVILTVPERTACYLCATRSRHEVERAGGRVAREVDYGTGRLRGEIALGADIQHVATAAVKLALSLLLPPGSEAGLRAFAEDVLASGTPYLTLSTVPGYWFYPRVFGETPGQGAYQSVWLTPRRSEDCPVCGPPGARIDPLRVPLRAPSRAALAKLLHSGAPD